MKKLIMMVVLSSLLAASAALAAELQYPNSLMFGLPEGPDNSAAILLDLPEGTLMTELVEFEGGDYIQTFQLPYGGMVQILRYEAFDMSLEELAEGEWTGYASLEEVRVEGLDASIEEGVHLKTMPTEESGNAEYDVYILRAEAANQVHLLQVVLSSEMGEQRIAEEINAMLDSVQVQGLDTLEWG